MAATSASLFTFVFYLVLKGIFLLLSRSFRGGNAADAKADTLKYYQENQATDGCYFTSPIKNKLGEGFKVYPDSFTLLPSNERITFEEIEAVEITTSRLFIYRIYSQQRSHVQIFRRNRSTHSYQWSLRTLFTSIPDSVRSSALPTLLQELGFKTVSNLMLNLFLGQDKVKLIYAPRN